MGLASFTGLLGKKKGKAAEARLDDEIVSQLVRVERPVAGVAFSNVLLRTSAQSWIAGGTNQMPV